MAKAPRSHDQEFAALMRAAEDAFYAVIEERLRRIVEAHRWNKAQFAEAAAISRSAASLLLRGKRRPSSGMMMRILMVSG